MEHSFWSASSWYRCIFSLHLSLSTKRFQLLSSICRRNHARKSSSVWLPTSLIHRTLVSSIWLNWFSWLIHVLDFGKKLWLALSFVVIAEKLLGWMRFAENESLGHNLGTLVYVSFRLITVKLHQIPLGGSFQPS